MKGMKLKIGVMGAASGPVSENKEFRMKAFHIGKAVAKAGCILVNGACPGLPDEAARGAKSAGGMCIGISPAFSEQEHTQVYRSPLKHHDIMIYTGFGLMERDILNIRSSDGIIILGGGIGTLNEFTIAYDEGVPLGVLTDCGGISNKIPEIVAMCERKMTSNMILNTDPDALVKKLVALIKKHPRPHFEDHHLKGDEPVKRDRALKAHR